jgi:hypothetical protein
MAFLGVWLLCVGTPKRDGFRKGTFTVNSHAARSGRPEKFTFFMNVFKERHAALKSSMQRAAERRTT